MPEPDFDEFDPDNTEIFKSIIGPPSDDDGETDDDDLGPFVIVPRGDVFGDDYSADQSQRILSTPNFANVWKWNYRFRQGKTASEEELALAERIARLAAALRDYGLIREDVQKTKQTSTGDGKINFKEPSRNAIATMESLLNVFSAALTTKQPAGEIKTYGKMVDDLEQDFLRRVVTKRTRTQMFRPIVWIVGAFAGFTALGLLTPALSQVVNAFGDLKTIATGFPSAEIIRAVCFVIAGVFLGRMIFFALTHSGSIASMDEYWKLEPQINFPQLSILFDIVVGLAAFLVFQTGFLTIAIGGETGVSSTNIMESELVAGLFGAIAGISRSAFLERVRGISSTAIKPER